MAAPDGVAQVMDTIPTDPAWPQQWGWTNQHAPAAWDVTNGDPSIVVADVDTGVDLTHADLAGALPPATTSSTTTPTRPTTTATAPHVAGIIGARANNGIGMAGWCSRCTIMPIKVMGANGSGALSTVAQGVVWATDHGADVINMSLGSYGDDPSLRSAVAYAISHDVVVVASAGNAATTFRPSRPTIPASSAVAATDQNDAFYSFSNRGSWVDVAAPGCDYATRMGGGYNPGFCGTSAAAPMVAGIAALARAALPSASVTDIFTALTTGVTTTYGSDVQYGKVDAAAVLAQFGAPATATPALAVTGPAQKSKTLRAAGGFRGVGLSYAYQWQRCNSSGAGCGAIAGATAVTYSPVAARRRQHAAGSGHRDERVGLGVGDLGATLVVVGLVTVTGTMTAVNRPLVNMITTSTERAGVVATFSGNDVPLSFSLVDSAGATVSARDRQQPAPRLTFASLPAGSYTVTSAAGSRPTPRRQRSPCRTCR